VLDQILSSASNFALSAFVAANVSARAFGAFTLVYAVYGMSVGLSGGLCSIPLVVRYSTAASARFRAATRASLGTAFAVGGVAGAVCFAVAAFASPTVAHPLRALGVTLPGLLVQDSWRYSFVAGGRPAKAATNDALWIMLQLLGIASLLAADKVTPVSMVLVWGGSATAASLFGCRQAGLVPAPWQALAWLRDQRALTWRYGAEAVLHRSGTWFALALVGSVAGLHIVGALRGALLLITGPLNLLFAGATFVFVSEGVRLLHRSPDGFPAAVRRLSAGVTTAAMVWCLVVLTIPAALGSRVLGSTWASAQPLLGVLALYAIALAGSVGPAQGMLSLGAARRSLFTQLAGFAADVPAMVGGAAVAGARGAAVGMGLSAVSRTALAWIQFRRGLHEPAVSLQPEVAAPRLSELTAS
jgi:hypothetical protein